MLSRKYRLAKKKDFEMVFKYGHSFFAKSLNIIILLDKNLPNYKIAFIVSKKVSKKAVLRNKIKRQLRAIFNQQLSKLKGAGYIIVIAKNPILKYDYSNIKRDVDYLLLRSKIL